MKTFIITNARNDRQKIEAKRFVVESLGVSFYDREENTNPKPDPIAFFATGTFSSITEYKAKTPTDTAPNTENQS